jgi:rare lipoprotein A
VNWLCLIALLALVAAARSTQYVSTEYGVASWYGDELRGRLMANGRPFNPDALTCASWKYPFGTRLKVTNREDGRWVVVTVTDRGPAKRLKRAIDLSEASFKRIADLDKGLVQVRIERLK